MKSRLFAMLCASLLCSSCASVTYTDEAGTRHVIGLVHVEFPAVDESQLAGRKVVVKTLGVSVLATEEVSGLTLGYAHEEYATFRNNIATGNLFDKAQLEGSE